MPLKQRLNGLLKHAPAFNSRVKRMKRISATTQQTRRRHLLQYFTAFPRCPRKKSVYATVFIRSRAM